MDDDLRNKFAPRRNKRYAHLRGFDEQVKWAGTLDWKNNDYDFRRVTRSVIDSLDSEYRGKWGVRVDELANEQELLEYFRICRARYEEEPVFQVKGIYLFLHLTMDLWLEGKAADLLRRRRAGRGGMNIGGG